MVAKKRATTGAKKLRLKKETLKDLGSKGGAVKGGLRVPKSDPCSDVCDSVKCLPSW